jgi:hypothetical protein
MSVPSALRIERGARTGEPVIISLDSTEPGPALGGCRVKPYPSWRDGLDDALRLSAAMTAKAALADMPYGGGKTVVALSPDTAPHYSGARRAALLADIGEVVESFGGRYITGPDVGTSPADMEVIGQHTRHVLCRPVGAGGSGDSSPPTAAGVLACIAASASSTAVRPASSPSRSRDSATSAASSPTAWQNRAPASWWPTPTPAASGSAAAGVRARPVPGNYSPARLTSWCPPPSAASSPRRPSPPSAAARSPGPLTTSSPTTPSPTCCTRTASPGHPTQS